MLICSIISSRSPLGSCCSSRLAEEHLEELFLEVLSPPPPPPPAVNFASPPESVLLLILCSQQKCQSLSEEQLLGLSLALSLAR